LSIQTTLIAAIAAFVGVKGVSDFQQLYVLEALCLVAAAAFSLRSIYVGMQLLNILPGAAQRRSTQRATDERKWDFYHIRTTDTGQPIYHWVDAFRRSFLWSTGSLVAFVVAVVVRKMMSNVEYSWLIGFAWWPKAL
jgi:hypothetical protein